jgi:hypothetical protein
LGTNACSGTVFPGNTCQVEVIFNPPFQATESTAFNFIFNSSKSIKQFSFLMSAVALSPPDIFVTFAGANSPNMYDFGDVPFLVKNYLSVNISNIGSAPANNFSLTIDQAALTSYSIVSTNCPTGGSLAGGGGCQAVLSYSPEDQSVHLGKFQINYSGYGNEPLPVEVSLNGEGVDPLAKFMGWYEIYSATGTIDGEVRVRWDDAIPTSGGIIIDGYKVYMNQGAPLPSGIDELVPFEVKSITGTTFPLREYTINNAPPDTLYYITVRPTYLGQVMATTDGSSNLKIMTPPVHMALVHPYMVNQEVCDNMSLTTEGAKNLGCPFEGAANIANYYDFNRYLYIDRYELSIDAILDYKNLPGVAPAEFTNQLIAGSACNNLSLTFQGQLINKRLVRRSEFVAAAAWEPHLNPTQVGAREAGTGANDCVLKHDNPKVTGSASNCISKFGAYDMIGNLWEWNSDQVNSSIGWVSSIDPTNDEAFGVNMGGLFPNQLTNLPCFSFALGVPQNFVPAICPDGIEISTNQNIFGNSFYFPPLSAGIKPVRSGGGVGPSGSFTGRKGGRWVGDYNSSITASTTNTGARCAFTLPFE